MTQVFYIPDAAKAIALAKENNGQLSVMVPVELDEVIKQDPSGFDCYVTELIFGKELIKNSKVRVLGYDADNVYSPCYINTENRILILVHADLHPEYLKPENEDECQLGDAATIRELCRFAIDNDDIEVANAGSKVRELYFNRSSSDETLTAEFKAIAKTAICRYATMYAGSEWRRETLNNDSVIRMLSWQLQQHFMEE
jgi:hypothetical protein